MVKAYKQKSMGAVKGEEKIKNCPECGSKDIEYEKEERYCKKCGLVIEE